MQTEIVYVVSATAIVGYFMGMALLTELIWGLIGRLTICWSNNSADKIFVQDASTENIVYYYALWPLGLLFLIIFTILTGFGVAATYIIMNSYEFGHRISKKLGVAK